MIGSKNISGRQRHKTKHLCSYLSTYLSLPVCEYVCIFDVHIYTYIKHVCLWLNNRRTIPLHEGQTQNWWIVPEALRVLAGAIWGTWSCQLLHLFFFQGFITGNTVCQETYVAAYCWVPLLPSHPFLPHWQHEHPFSVPLLSWKVICDMELIWARTERPNCRWMAELHRIE